MDLRQVLSTQRFPYSLPYFWTSIYSPLLVHPPFRLQCLSLKITVELLDNLKYDQ